MAANPNRYMVVEKVTVGFEISPVCKITAGMPIRNAGTIKAESRTIPPC